jgi:hydroxymethylpyrimidine/phosphomethylpyrimidine kinase
LRFFSHFLSSSRALRIAGEHFKLTEMTPPAAIAISATDPTGGLLADDLVTLNALGILGSGIVSAMTTCGIRLAGACQDVPVPFLRASLEAALAARPPDAVKVGILTTVPAVRTVAKALSRVAAPRVLDPGFGPRSGVRLLRSSVLDAEVSDLFPGAAIVIVNPVEAATLAGFPVRSESDAKAAARRVQALGPSAVLVTGGSGDGPTVVDGLLDGRTWHRFEAPRAESPIDCGAGGLVSAAVTAWLAAGETLPDAVSRALAFARTALTAGWPDAPLR